MEGMEEAMALRSAGTAEALVHFALSMLVAGLLGSLGFPTDSCADERLDSLATTARSSTPNLSREMRARLTVAATDATLNEWQREFMHDLSQAPTPEAVTGVGRVAPSLPGGADATWSEVPTPPLGGHTAIYDPVRDRMIVFGGFAGQNRGETWALDLSGIPAWTLLAPSGTPPSARSGSAAIYDPVRDRMVIFGGYAGGLYPGHETWALSLSGVPAWTQLFPSGAPPKYRSGHTAIYDPIRDRMVIFGGYGRSYLHDVWVLDLGGTPSWTEMAAPGARPSGRVAHTAIYDPVRDRMVIFGGEDGVKRDDVWAFDLAGISAWTELVASGSRPRARRGHAATYDPLRDQMVVVGGFTGIYPDTCDAWALGLAGVPIWTKLEPMGGPPTPRNGHTAIYDPVRDQVVLFSGSSNVGAFQDTWALALAPGPEWTLIVPSMSPPSERSGHTAIYDPVRDRMIVFGGRGYYDTGPFADTWELPLKGTPAWRQILPSGTQPPARFDHTAVYDPVRDRMVVFGGLDSTYSERNDAWELSFSPTPAWTELAQVGAVPAQRHEHTAIYDPVRDRMIVYGGINGSNIQDDIWELALAGSPVWTQIMPHGMPIGRYAHTSVYDPVRDRMLVFGGWNGRYLHDAWALSLEGTTGWTRLAPSGPPPIGRMSHSAIYDPSRDRLVIFAGFGGSYRNDSWALSVGASPAWTELLPSSALPGIREGHSAIYDPVRDRMIVFGGFQSIDPYNSRAFSDTWALDWEAPAERWLVGAQVTDAGTTLFDNHPNPFNPLTMIRFQIGQRSQASLTIYDAEGRLVRTLVDGMAIESGVHTVEWDSRNSRGQELGSGVYFARLEAQGKTITRKMILIK